MLVKMLKSLVLLFCLLFHPVHVTMTSIDYVPENDSLKVFVKMYFDDFMLDLAMSGEQRDADFFTTSNQEVKEAMELYLNKKLTIMVNKKSLEGKLNDLKIVDNEVKLNLEYKTSKQPVTLTIKNQIMTELYKDQSNLIIVRIDNFEEGVKLTPENTEQTFKIK